MQRRPDLFLAYVGLGQLVNGRRNEELSYQFVVDEAKRRGDAAALAELAPIHPPYQMGQGLEVQRRWLATYRGSIYATERAREALPAALFGREYTLATRLRYFSCLRSSLDRLFGGLDDFDAIAQIPRLEVPVFLFAGRHDWNTPYPLVEEWAAVLEAPHVEIVWFEGSRALRPDRGARGVPARIDREADAARVALSGLGVQFTRRPPFQYFSRSTYFCSLPVAVRGSAATNSTEVGHLKCARCPRQNASSSASVSVVPGLQHDERLRRLAPLLVRHADHRAFEHRRVLVERVLDLGRADVLAARDDHVLLAVDDVDRAALVPDREVAGVEVAAVDRLRRSPPAAPSSP